MHPVTLRSEQSCVIALVATRQRHASLDRALASVGAQSRRPDALVVVDDSGNEIDLEVTRACLDRAPFDRAEWTLLANRRTPGAAGAWNSGLDEIARSFGPPEYVFVAVLDDDDTWTPEHIERCMRIADEQRLDMVAAGLVRFDEQSPGGRRQLLPSRLSAHDAFVGNPHVQGSNLFVRLSTLLEAGLFDESLPSTTDRDLLVRLSDLGTVRFGVSDAHTVLHDASGGRARLSTPGSTAKTEGLRAFWRKYQGRMSLEEKARFQARAASLFGCSTLQDPAPSAPTSPGIAPMDGPPVALVAGVIADADMAGASRLAPLLDDLLSLQQAADVASLQVVVLENGAQSVRSPLYDTVERVRARGLNVYFATHARQCEDALAGVFGTISKRPEGRVGIGRARTMLQRYVYVLARTIPGAVAWILDDDKRLDALVHDRGLVRAVYPVIPALRALRARGADVVLGVDTDAPPLPAVSALRTQLVDLHANLCAMASMDVDGSWPDRLEENLAHARRGADYYYDLARAQTWHLETPFWFPCAAPNESVGAAFARLCERAPRMLAGEQVFRPLYVEAHAPLTAEPSALRGGNTFVFDLDALRDVPNCVPDLDGRETRRSDMIWALLNRVSRGRSVVRASIPVRHDRSQADASSLDLERFADDVRGYALFRALSELLGREGTHALSFSEDEVVFAARRYEKYLRERSAAFVLNVHRARGLCGAIVRVLGGADAWWNLEEGSRHAAELLTSFARRVEEQCSPERLGLFLARLEEPHSQHFVNFLDDLAQRVSAARDVPIDVTLPWLAAQRAELARHHLTRLYGDVRVDLLGKGAEGVVWTDGARVFKVFDRWRVSEESGAFLRSIVGKCRDARTLCSLDTWTDDSACAITTYRYEPSEAYRGGHGADLVRLLQECRAHGVVCRNVHPDNLRVTAHGVRLIDYGTDIVPFSEGQWRRMVQRTWLTWRWWERRDLKTLMRDALTQDVPALDGWERMLEAANARSKEQLLDPIVVEFTRRESPRRVLDYGCGRGRISHAIAMSGAQVLAYDPVRSPGWNELISVSFTDKRDEALAAGPFDLVVCSLVLCTLAADAYHRALRDLRASLDEGGRAVIAVCNPFSVCGGDTPLQRRELPHDADPARTFEWSKVMASTGRRRTDVHRPFSRLREDLLRVGLVVETREETRTVDIERFEPASDFLVMTARAVSAGPVGLCPL